MLDLIIKNGKCYIDGQLKGVDVAIKDGKSGTIFIYSPRTVKKINVEKILEKCKIGDSILIMTKDTKFSLPHNDLLVY
mgnify:CR=1 FL=1